jgi:DNA-binding Lrp family transcriptional regulator
VAKLVKEGVIEKFTIEISPEYQLMAIVCIKVRSQQPTHEVVKKLKKLGLEEVFEVAGRYDVICIAKVHSSYDLNELLEKIRATKDVVETESFTVLKKN